MAEPASETRVLSGGEKAAALLLAMGNPLAGRLLKHFDPQELRQIAGAAAQLGTVSSAVLESLIDEFKAGILSGTDVLGNAGEAEQLLTGGLAPEQAADILSDVFGSSNANVWEKLANVPETAFVAYLANEHPQTAAFILSKVSTAFATKITSQLSRDLRNKILQRMLTLEPVSDEALRIVESALQEDLLEKAHNSADGSRARIAEIVNNLDATEVEDVIQSIAGARPKEAALLKKLLLSFEDLPRLSMRARATLFDQVPTETMVLALRGTEAEFRDVMLSSMASRARRLIESELSNSSEASQREIAKSRRSIANLALQMSRRGEIEIPAADEAEVT